MVTAAHKHRPDSIDAGKGVLLMISKKLSAPALAVGAIGVVGASVVGLGATGTLGAFSAIITNQDNVVAGATVQFSQTQVDSFSLNATQLPGTDVRTSVNGGTYTALDEAIFPVLTTATQPPVVSSFILENTGTSSATVNIDLVAADALEREGVPLDVAVADPGTLFDTIKLSVRASLLEGWDNNPTAESTWVVGNPLGNTIALDSAEIRDRTSDETPLVIGAGQKMVIETTMVVDADELDNLGEDYEGADGSVDLIFEMTPTLADPTV